MRLLAASAALLASGALAFAPPPECLAQEGGAFAEAATCGEREPLASCLSNLKDIRNSQVESCYTEVGCSADEATAHAEYVLQRCQELASRGELKKRSRQLYQRADKTAPTDGDNKAPKETAKTETTKEDCYTSTTFSTTQCDPTTIGGHLTTLPCKDIVGTSTFCRDGFLCDRDDQGGSLCLKMKNDLDTGGIIVAIVLGGATVIGFAFLTFLCCRESRQHKRAAAQAEAKALARAATKKQRAQEARAPLMRQPDTADPFHDQHQS